MTDLVSVGSKLTLANFLVLALLTALIYGGLSRYEKDKMISAKEQGARMAGDLFLREAMAPVFFDDEVAIKEGAALLAQDPEVIGVQMWRVAPGRRVGALLTAQFEGQGPGERGVAPRWVEAGSMERQADRIILRDAVRDRDHQPIALVAVQFSLLRENRAFLELRRQILLLAAGAGTLLALLLGAVSRRWITGPLARLLRAVGQVEAGERVDLHSVHAKDEVGRLAQAFARMAEAVDRRERELLRRNRDMKLIMDHVAQGLLSVERSGALLPEHSVVVERWLGPWPGAGTFAEYLARAAPQAGEWLGGLWDNVSADIFPLEVALGQLPRRLTIGARVFAVLYTPIQRGPAGDDVNILIVLSDISAEQEQERAKRDEQEMISMVHWLGRDRAGLEEFFASSDRLVEALGAAADPVQLRRDVHTLKGNSGIFGLQSVVAACQALEERLAEGGPAASLPPAEGEALRAAWRRVSERRRQLLGDERRRGIEIDETEHQGLLAALRGQTPRAEIAAAAQAWLREPAQRRLSRLGEQARQLARRMGKGEIAVQVEAGALRLPEQGLQEFWDSFAHLLRNAIDHGLETPAERQERGKSAAGSVRLRMAVVAERLLVEIEDDGRGIDWARLGQRARAAGLPAETRDDLVAALFADGISTRSAVTETSGRGVGMSAVRSACERSGGEVRVYSEPGAGTRFQFAWPAAILR